MKWSEKSKGLGDTVAKVTQLTGIKSVVDTVSKKWGRTVDVVKGKIL